MKMLSEEPRLREVRSPGDPDATHDRLTELTLFRDLIASFKAPGFWLYGAWIDAALRYRSQALGAFWMVGSTLAFVILLGTLYSRVLKVDSDLYYGHVATGYAFWLFIQQSLNMSTRIYKRNVSLIQNGYVKYVEYVLRLVCTQAINLGYNLLVVIGVILLTPVHVTAEALVLIVTVPLLLLAVLGMCIVLSIVSARYPDIGELVQTLLRLFFFITPIIWMPGQGKGAIIGTFLYGNPFYYLIEIVRGPLVYNQVPWLEIGVVAAAVPLIWLMAAVAYARAKPFIPMWI
jgi:ABC-type polysaccharide/polyol phosphate export permease